MMVGTFPKYYNIGLSVTGKVDVMANTPNQKTCYCSILIEKVGHLPHKDLVEFILVVVPYVFLSSRSPACYLMF